MDLPRILPRELKAPGSRPPMSLLNTPPPPGKSASFHYLEEALELIDQKASNALVTGPIDKKKWQDAGIPYKGHTEYLQSRYPKQAIMFFWSPRLKVALYTVHCPLRSIFDQLSEEMVFTYLSTLIPCLDPFFSTPCRIALAGLNPHAGEKGIMGDEEERVIRPAMEKIQKQFANQLIGPIPPDTLFYSCRNEEDLVIIAWYHDQGLIPFKLLHFHEGVNITLGLPFLRTSPDHGTAVDLKGTDRIHPGSMIEAVRSADRWLTWKGSPAAVP